MKFIIFQFLVAALPNYTFAPLSEEVVAPPGCRYNAFSGNWCYYCENYECCHYVNSVPGCSSGCYYQSAIGDDECRLEDEGNGKWEAHCHGGADSHGYPYWCEYDMWSPTANAKCVM